MSFTLRLGWKQPVTASFQPESETMPLFPLLGVVQNHPGPELDQRRIHSKDGTQHANTWPPTYDPPDEEGQFPWYKATVKRVSRADLP